MDWKIVGGMLLLFSGAGALISNIAALFGYGVAFTLVLLPVCVLMAVIVGAAISRRLAKPGAPLPPYDERSPQYASYQRQRREGKIRAKWMLLCGFVCFLLFLPVLWFCEWMGWPRQIYFAVLPIACLGTIQVAGTAIGDRMVKRALN
jgi:hypothetical protein